MAACREGLHPAAGTAARRWATGRQEVGQPGAGEGSLNQKACTRAEVARTDPTALISLAIRKPQRVESIRRLCNQAGK